MRRIDPEPGGLLDRLEAAWARQLRWHYEFFNYDYLASQLRPPVILISDSGGRLGEWSALHRTISISRRHILEHSWDEVLQTLRHEMAHQYVDEVLELAGAPPHGEPFLKACRLLRCDPRASVKGLQPLAGSDAERDRMLQRVKELLALAGSPNEHEAANAMRMAHKYLLKYNLDIAQLDEARGYTTRWLGQSARRIQEYEYTLAALLQDHFFVLAIWTYSYDALTDAPGRILEIAGTPENLEMAAYVYDYVMGVATRLWEERRRRRDRTRGTKLQYLAGLLRGLKDKLDAQRTELREEHGLIWLGDPELKSYYRWLHPRTRTVTTGGVSRNNSYHAGVRDGREITIRRGIGGGSADRGRMLPGPGS